MIAKKIKLNQKKHLELNWLTFAQARPTGKESNCAAILEMVTDG
jgi:hypothetical protein